MENTSKRDAIISCACWVIMSLCYIAERSIDRFVAPDKHLGYSQAYIYFAVYFAVFLICVTCNAKPFYSMMTSLIGFRMIPPLDMLKELSPNAYIAYFLASKLLMILFVIALITEYRKQSEKERVNPLQILSLIVIMPFFQRIIETVGEFTKQTYDTMIPTYLVQFIFYIIGALLILYIAYDSATNAGTHFVCNFELVTLGINLVLRVITIIVLITGNQYVSKSHYCWAVIFAFLMMLFLIVKEDRIRSKMRKRIVKPNANFQ